MATPRRIRKLFEHLGPCSTAERVLSANSPALQVGVEPAAAAEGEEKRPNLLYIISDQHNPFVTGCYGDEIVSTPHLDSLAARGVTLDHCCKDSPPLAPHPTPPHPAHGVPTHAHAGSGACAADCVSPICTPARMSMLTGRHPYQNECWTNNDQLDSGTPTFAHACGAAGYNPVLVGRMHSNGPDQLCASSAIRRLAGLEA